MATHVRSRLNKMCRKGRRACHFWLRAAILTGPVITLLVGAALIGQFYPVPHIVAMFTEAIGAAAADSLVGYD